MAISRLIELPRGLYVMRVAGGLEGSVCRIAAAPGHEKSVEIWRSPESRDNDDVPSCDGVAILCKRDALIEFSYDRDVPSAKPWDFSVQRLDLESARLASDSAASRVGRTGALAVGKTSSSRSNRGSEAAIESSTGVLMGHVSRRGDVFASTDDWLGGPDSPTRIEGILFKRSAFPMIESYAVQAADGRWSPTASVGEFAGSRGRSMPIVRLKINCVEDNLTGVEVECLFLGGRPVAKSGADLEFCGPTGSEPLIGIRARTTAVVPKGGAIAISSSKLQSLSRVKVFRSDGAA